MLMSGLQQTNSLNAAKAKYLFFHEQSARDSIPLRLPTITFNTIEIKRESFIKFLGVIIDENITWDKHIGLHIMQRKKSLKYIYFSFIHNYVNDCNIAWARTTRTKLDKVLKKQRHAVRILYNKDNKDKFKHSKPLMRDVNALNVYKTNIFQVLKFMYKAKRNLNPRVFDNTFTEIHHR